MPIYEKMDSKTAIVHSARNKSENHQVLSFQSGINDLENDAPPFTAIKPPSHSDRPRTDGHHKSNVCRVPQKMFSKAARNLNHFRVQ